MVTMRLKVAGIVEGRLLHRIDWHGNFGAALIGQLLPAPSAAMSRSASPRLGSGSHIHAESKGQIRSFHAAKLNTG
jgi:hypothetical protein